jgi:hypothetical protein
MKLRRATSSRRTSICRIAPPANATRTANPYADQTERDYRAFIKAVREGRIKATPEA